MYNGIGLETPRGSGTNGYVQRNLAFLRLSREKPNYRTEEDIKKSEATLNKPPNPEILEHERLRKVELKCFELRELMTEQNYDDDEIESKVSEYRRLLVQQMNSETSGSKTSAATSELVDDFGRPIARETHQIAELQLEKNARLKRAFGIGDDHVGGAALRRNGEPTANSKKQKTGDETRESRKLEAKSRSKKDAGGVKEKLRDSDKPASDVTKIGDKKRRTSPQASLSDVSSDEEATSLSDDDDDSDSSASSSSSTTTTTTSSSSEQSTPPPPPPQRHKSRKGEKSEKREHHKSDKYRSDGRVHDHRRGQDGRRFEDKRRPERDERDRRRR